MAPGTQCGIPVSSAGMAAVHVSAHACPSTGSAGLAVKLKHLAKRERALKPSRNNVNRLRMGVSEP